MKMKTTNTKVYFEGQQISENAPVVLDDEKLDEYVTGVLRRNFVTFTMTYPRAWLMETENRKVSYGNHKRFLGLDWWDWKIEFEGVVKMEGDHSFSIQPTTKPLEIKAEWWRRLGYVIFRHLPENRGNA